MVKPKMPNLITRLIPAYMNLWHFIGVLFKKVITNNMRKLFAVGKCNNMVRDRIIVAVPLSLAILSLILDLILIK